VPCTSCRSKHSAYNRLTTGDPPLFCPSAIRLFDRRAPPRAHAAKISGEKNAGRSGGASNVPAHRPAGRERETRTQRADAIRGRAAQRVQIRHRAQAPTICPGAGPQRRPLSPTGPGCLDPHPPPLESFRGLALMPRVPSNARFFPDQN
jgi:hypothetical protein